MKLRHVEFISKRLIAFKNRLTATKVNSETRRLKTAWDCVPASIGAQNNPISLEDIGEKSKVVEDVKVKYFALFR